MDGSSPEARARSVNAQEVFCAVADGHVQGAGDEPGGLGSINGPADDAAGAGIQDHGAVDLAFAGGVLGDVSDPLLVGQRPGELAVDQVTRGRRLVLGAGRRLPGRPLIPARRMSISTAPWPTVMPKPSLSSACTRRDP
jgi:hypothetical protein